MPKMRAKMKVINVAKAISESGETLSERLSFVAVSKDGAYPIDGSDEDNTYARWSPDANLNITVANPALFDQFKVGEKYYVDFTQAE